MAKRRSSRRIPKPNPEIETAQIQFSFKYLEIEHQKFRLNDCPVDFLRKLLCKVKDFESYTVDQFIDVNHQDDRMLIQFDESACPKGFESLDEELQSETAWELKLCHDAKRHTQQAAWRVYGMLVRNVFYVIWLDAQHALFPDHHPKHATNKSKG